MLIFKRLIFAILIIINCMVIFFFSSQNSEQSSETSGGIVEIVVEKIAKYKDEAEKQSIRDNVTFLVRKTAHFSIYTLLGIWLMCEANTFEISNKRKLVICVAYGCLYAISDEIHQSFVSGRSQEIRDICIDTLGSLFGGSLVLLICKIKKALYR